jgi:hypothetical protein
MAISFTAAGTVGAADIQRLVIVRSGGGVLTAQVTFNVATPSGSESRSANWTLSAAEKTAIAGLLPGAQAAIEDAVGL